MIGALLTILKIIGIILLIILALIIVIVLSVLFVPVRYQVKGSYNDIFRVTGKVTWAFPLLYLKATYENEFGYVIRILGIPIPLNNKKNEESNINTSLLVDETNRSTRQDNVAENISDKKNPDTPKHENDVPGDTVIEIEEQSKEKKSFIEKIKDKIRQIKEKIIGFIDKIKNIKNKAQETKEKVQYYVDVLKSDTGRKAFETCKERLFKLLKSICPNKGEVNITFGLEDPATMGKILGVHGMLYPVIGNLIILNPDFDNKCFLCDFYIKGKIRAGTILYQVLRVVFDENCKRLLKLLKGRK